MPPKKSEGTGGTAKGGEWTSEANIKLLMIIMEHNNPDLAISGWSEILERAKVVLEGKDTVDSIRKPFAKLRKQFLESVPPKAGGSGAATTATTATKVTKATKATAQKRKRAEPADLSSGGEDDGDNAGDKKAKAPAQKKTKKAATNGKKGKGKAKSEPEPEMEEEVKAEFGVQEGDDEGGENGMDAFINYDDA